MDKDRFSASRQIVLAGESPVAAAGIGTLGEKPLHAVIKHYLEPDPAKHEQKIGAYVADIFTGERIYEIQTCQFGKLREKLSSFLNEYPVTIVYPMQARKWLIWVNPDSGECSSPRLSPRRGRIFDVMPELYRIKPLLSHPNLSLLILQVDLEEYRLLNGWSRDRKKGSRRDNRIPGDLVSELQIIKPEDYKVFFPQSLPADFTSLDFAGAASVSRHQAQTTLNILSSLGIAELVGKRGRMLLYRRL